MTRITEKILLVLNDLIAVNLAFGLIYFLKYKTGIIDSIIPVSNNSIFLASGLLTFFWAVSFLFFGLYRSKFFVSRTDEMLNIFKAVTFGSVLIFLQSFDLSNPLPASRIILFTYWGLLFFMVSVGRICLRSYQKILLKKGLGQRKTIIIGTGKRAKEVYKQIVDHPVMGFDVKGFLEFEAERLREIPDDLVIGGVNTVNDICAENKIEEVLIILDRPSRKRLFEIVDACNGYPVALKTIPDIYQIAVGNTKIHNLFGLQLVDILPQNYSAAYRIIKRSIDIAISLLIIFLLMPVWVVTGVLIKLDSKGPIFFKQERVGMNGAQFMMYKFRSMEFSKSKKEEVFLTQNPDPRVTKFGNFIRKFRIDEVPQFINVLEGDMSIIGPRPELPFYVIKHNRQIPLYSKRFRIKPGITGLAQVKQLFHDSVTNISKKLEYDLYYLENMSLKLDLKILLATIYTVLARRGG
ncbi:MAG: sugar transferase [bacterium]|nr:sugar transferase [bacterium]